jgi:hypothetical protein
MRTKSVEDPDSRQRRARQIPNFEQLGTQLSLESSRLLSTQIEQETALFEGVLPNRHGQFNTVSLCAGRGDGDALDVRILFGRDGATDLLHKIE